jgi:FixJ family two-component response regulator
MFHAGDDVTRDPLVPRKTRKRVGRANSTTKAPAKSTVIVVDDDPSILGALARLLRTAGYRARSFSRAESLLVSRIPRRNACVVADINLPGMNGVELCDALARSGAALPYILITGRDDAATRRIIEKAHPLAVLNKPIDEAPLLKAIARAVALSQSGLRRA